MDGNARYAAGKLASLKEDLQALKQKTAGKQEPFAAVLSCADSRVLVEIVFDQTIGHVFVTRVAGNIATPEIIGSLEYGVAVLGKRPDTRASPAGLFPGDRRCVKQGRLKVVPAYYDPATGVVTLLG